MVISATTVASLTLLAVIVFAIIMTFKQDPDAFK